MKTLHILICLSLLCAQLQAQHTRSPYRKGYLRMGLSSLGNNPDNSLSPKDNVLSGNYGASQGYVFESGHVFYFGSSKSKINYGLDWTILSATYNKMDRWSAYSANGDISGTQISASVASKLGPVVSFNPVKKLVIDLRFQVTTTERISDMDYEENISQSSYKSFSFNNDGSVKDVLSFGLGTNFGISIRRKAIGVALDYASVKANTNYTAVDGENNFSAGKVKIPTHSLQLKLSITL